MSMFRKDWIERQIEEVARALAKLLQLEREKSYQAAETLVQETAQSLTGMDYSTLLALDAASIASVLERPERLFALAQVLKRDGEVRGEDRLDREQARELRALELYRLVRVRAPASLPTEEAISKLLVRLGLANGPQSE
jgi:hypothetical protein